MVDIDKKTLQREILLGLWKIHILHHAGEGPIIGQWMIQELRRHGYDVSPGTIYPILNRMARLGWLRRENVVEGNPHGGYRYFLTEAGRGVLEEVRRHIYELKAETFSRDH